MCPKNLDFGLNEEGFIPLMIVLQAKVHTVKKLPEIRLLSLSDKTKRPLKHSLCPHWMNPHPTSICDKKGMVKLVTLGKKVKVKEEQHGKKLDMNLRNSGNSFYIKRKEKG